MVNLPSPPILAKPIPAQIINEGASFGPFNLNEFIKTPDEISGKVRFTAELDNGKPLPKGLICTTDGYISGIPANGTIANYQFVIVAENESTIPLITQFSFSIKQRTALETAELVSQLKSRVWEALGKNLPIPELESIFDRPVTPMEVYYLLQRFATLTIWDVYNLDSPGPLKLLTLEGMSPHFNVYDRGSCIVVTPKDLFSHERTLEDALQSSRAAAREVVRRNWVIEFAGFDKMARAAWIELQLLGDQLGKRIEILHYTPREEDIKLYNIQAQSIARKVL